MVAMVKEIWKNWVIVMHWHGFCRFCSHIISYKIYIHIIMRPIASLWKSTMYASSEPQQVNTDSISLPCMISTNSHSQDSISSPYTISTDSEPQQVNSNSISPSHMISTSSHPLLRKLVLLVLLFACLHWGSFPEMNFMTTLVPLLCGGSAYLSRSLD